MNQEQVLSAARWAVTTLGTVAVSRGYATDEQVIMAAGVVVAVIPLVWSYFVHKTAA